MGVQGLLRSCVPGDRLGDNGDECSPLANTMFISQVVPHNSSHSLAGSRLGVELAKHSVHW